MPNLYLYIYIQSQPSIAAVSVYRVVWAPCYKQLVFDILFRLNRSAFDGNLLTISHSMGTVLTIREAQN